ncbi:MULTISPECIES: hypothetical protein [unclassified Stenotrophomonas]|uniref:hypothetical protein n=1 Tax=Stenotrophomonas TaxID=40323 RepID=UPI000B192098|nr:MULTISPECIES: hypothetical protein [unclassified Stenotrophomonas]MCM2994363.1 hypothetical protein [Stenotrophomonas maltophilia]QNG88778.1 hypothetical protein PLCFDHLH_04514 [Stenotrophomonas maltophilia]
MQTGTSILNPRVVANAGKLQSEFRCVVPFPHLVIDDFLDLDFAELLSEQFPPFDCGNSMADDGTPGGKSTVEAVRSLGTTYRRLDYCIRSPEFLLLLSRLTGIDGLIYDPWYLGGGTHESRDGTSLDPHIDANFHPVEHVFPQGATVEQIKTAGRINSTHQAIGYTLKGLARSGQAICHRSGVRGIWRLSSHTQHAIAPLRAAPARERPTCVVGPLTGVSDAATTIRHRELDRQQLADDLDAFLAAGGHIEVLGHTPLRPQMSRHTANHGSYAERMAAHEMD